MGLQHTRYRTFQANKPGNFPVKYTSLVDVQAAFCDAQATVEPSKIHFSPQIWIRTCRVGGTRDSLGLQHTHINHYRQERNFDVSRPTNLVFLLLYVWFVCWAHLLFGCARSGGFWEGWWMVFLNAKFSPAAPSPDPISQRSETKGSEKGWECFFKTFWLA